ncbi:MAG TPA: DUF4118 domain-containing protein [Jiangellaceae bacterium]|nr:DUF4118 domain-containing protein [Jiangellaceae bacterium]
MTWLWARSRSTSRLAGVLCALSAGVWFDFFLTEPYNRFTINDRADVETTVLLLLVGVAVTELCAWGRRQAALASRQAGYLAGIYAAAEAVATTESSPSALMEKVAAELTTLLGLERGGGFRGRFLMTAEPNSRPSQTERLVAVSLADQVGAALTEYGARG